MLYNYRRVARYCPSDGHYVYTPFTSDCFGGDWVSIPQDHTPGDANGNMMLVNASPYSGTFLTTKITGLKGGTTYEFSVWMMNVCKPTDKCPFPLLPNIAILLQRPDGKVVTQFNTGELIRHMEPLWTRYQVMFTTTPSENTLSLTMVDNSPGGCGNDFALDDISVRECVIIPPVTTAKPKLTPAKKTPPPPAKKETPPPPKKEAVVKPKPEVKKEVPPPVLKPVKPPVLKPAEKPTPKKQPPKISQSAKAKEPPKIDLPLTRPEIKPDTVIAARPKPQVLPPPPPLLATRSNPLTKLIEAEPGEIRIDLYDNGEIDGDTISVYHNNVLLISHARLSDKAISFHITVDPLHPHHELVMVAHNLGSIPPNTALMVVTAGTKRYEVFISSNEQKNGKLVIDLKE